ncbi:MAG: glucosamine-6-phosphate deaminase, partial [Flavobacteriaceae bacterium]|nr:glucosamine-6-phosphate deaminase [Flavobacteriaceae bacterium]
MKKSIISFVAPGTFEENRFEKLHNISFESPEAGSIAVADEICELIRSKQKKNEMCVLGLATGSSPISVYKKLIESHKKKKLSFRNVITFNLDEYFGLEKIDINSYNQFMRDNLFNHIDILPKNIHIPKGKLQSSQVIKYCKDYEQKILKAGGIDLQILGIGRTGHIGFNEPGSNINSQTRLVTLDHLTRFDATPAFNGLDNVPRKAITVGIKTILSAKRIILLAWGTNKSDIIQKAIEGEINSNIPTTYLQNHNNTTVVVDHEAASKLTRIKTPWITGDCNWKETNIQSRAVHWLCKK